MLAARRMSLAGTPVSTNATATPASISRVAAVHAPTIGAQSRPQPGVTSTVMVTMYSPTISASNPDSGTLNSTDFTGSNGAAWPSPWITSFSGGTGIIDIQSGAGRLQTPAAVYSMARASLPYTATNVEATCRFRFSSVSEQYFAMGIRGDNAWGSNALNTGYSITFSAADSLAYFSERNSGTVTNYSTLSFSISANTWYRAKIQATGTTIRYRAWLDGTTEPSTWTTEVTDSTIATGTHCMLSQLSGNSSTARRCDVDDFVLTNLGTPGGGGSTTTTNFTGTNGAAFPSPWVDRLTTSGGSHTIQNNRGQFVSPAIAAYANGVAVEWPAPPANFEVRVDFLAGNPSNEWYQRFAFRDQGDLAAQYFVSLNNSGTVGLWRQDASFVQTAIGSSASLSPLVNGTTVVHFRVNVNGTAIKVRWWKDAASEPSTWNVDTTDSTYSSGEMLVYLLGGNAAVVNTTAMDDWSIADLGGSGGSGVYGVVGLHGHGGGPGASTDFGSGRDYPVDTGSTVDWVTRTTTGPVSLGGGAYAWSTYSGGNNIYPSWSTTMKPILDAAAAGLEKVVLHGFSAGGAVANMALINNWQPPDGDLVGVVFDDPADLSLTFANPGSVPVVLYGTHNGSTWNANDLNGFDVLAKYEAAYGVTRKKSSDFGGPTDHAPMTRLGGSGPYATDEELSSTPFWNPGGGSGSGDYGTLIFEDNFDGSTLDSAKWNTNYSWGYYSGGGTPLPEGYNQPSQVTVTGGYCKITAEKINTVGYNPNTGSSSYVYPWRCGVITSWQKFVFKYGVVEFRARWNAPSAQSRGMWPALWLLGESGANEIDVLELLGDNIERGYANVHWGSVENQLGPIYVPSIPLTAQTWNLYRLDWQAGYIKVYFNDIEVLSTTTSINQNMYLLANLSVGGPWPQPTNGSSLSGASWDIDYVRVWQ